MNITNLRRLTSPPSPRGFRPVARFSLEVTPEITLFDFEAVLAPSGSLEIYAAPTRNGSRSAALAPAFRSEVAALVKSEMENDQRDQQQIIRIAN